MESLVIAVVGGGNGCYTIAGDMALLGHRVRMWPDSRDGYPSVLDTGAITVTGLGRTGTGRLELVSEDVGEVMNGADVVVCTDPAFTQEDRAMRITPHLVDGQIVFLSPGSLGSYLIATAVRRGGNDADVTYAEPATLPYLTRKTDSATVQVSGTAVHLPIGVFPAKRTGWAVERLRTMFAGSLPVEDALSVALLNVGPIIHSVLVLLNTGPIEHFERWDIHNEGTTSSVRKLILLHDAERIAVREALGYAAPHWPMAHHYQPEADQEWMYGRQGHTDLVKSEQWREHLGFFHRYIQEDVHHTLALLASIGNLAGVETPIMDSLLRLIGAITGQDHLHGGRTLANLGLSGMSVADLQRLLSEGLPG